MHKNIDPTKFPPCKKVLEEQIKRAWYIANVYKSAGEAYPAFEYTPIDCGWKLSESSEYLEINWFEGAQVPDEIEQIDGSDAGDNVNSDDENEEDYDKDIDESGEADCDEDNDITF